MSLEGKTISRVVDLDYDGQLLVFADGTAVHLQGTGYETDGCSVDQISEEEALRMEVDCEERRRRLAVDRERNIARRELKARIKRNVSAKAWQHWQRVHVPPAEALGDLLMGSMCRDLSRQAYAPVSIGSLAAIPFAKTKARRR